MHLTTQKRDIAGIGKIAYLDPMNRTSTGSRMASNSSHVAAFIRHLLKAIRLYLPGMIALLGTCLLLTGIEQGIDVVILAGESIAHGLCTMIAVCFMSYILWFSSRLLSYTRQQKDDSLYTPDVYARIAIPTSVHQHIPRLLAYNCFVVVQLSIFQLSGVHAQGTLVLLIFFALHNVLYFLFSEFISNPVIQPWKQIAIILFIVSYSGFLIYTMAHYASGIGGPLASDPQRHQFWLPLLSILCFCFQLIYVCLFIRRRKEIDATKRQAPRGGKSPSFLRQDTGNAERSYFKIFNIIGLAGGGIYLAVVFFLPMAAPIGPLAFALLAFAILAGACNRIIVFNIEYDFNFFFALFFLAWLMSFAHDPYKVRLLATNKTPFLFHSRPEPKVFIKRWLDDKIARHHPDARHPYPVYLVLSNGGASRAGRWVSNVLSDLQDASIRHDKAEPFSDHILSIAGASGGSVGNCAFYGLLKANLTGDTLKSFSAHSNAFFSSDFLTFTLGRLLGPDMIRHLLILPMDDRAAALERLLSHSNDALLNKMFDMPLTGIIDTSGRLPALFINSTEVTNGIPGVISSIKLSTGTLRTDMLALVDSMSVKRKYLDNMRLSTAAILSSRFPYVSPAGNLDGRYFVDGGYFDNSGAGTTLEFLQEISDFMKDPVNRSYQFRFAFHVIHLNNAAVIQPPGKPLNPLNNDLLAPVLTIINIQNSSTSISDRVMENNFSSFTSNPRDSIIRYDLYDTAYSPPLADRLKKRPSSEPVYPMSWVMSDYQQDRMDSALRRVRQGAEAERLFYFYNTPKKLP